MSSWLSRWPQHTNDLNAVWKHSECALLQPHYITAVQPKVEGNTMLEAASTGKKLKSAYNVIQPYTQTHTLTHRQMQPIT